MPLKVMSNYNLGASPYRQGNFWNFGSLIKDSY